MKIIHSADWHLGKIIYSHSMLDEQRHFIFDFLQPLILKETPDAVILAGDIFDRSIAPTEAIKLFDGFISFMSENNIPLLAITGNHDGRERITLGADLLKKSGIYIATDISDAFSPVELECGQDKFRFYLIPHFEPAQAREYFKDESIKGFSEAYKAVCGKIGESLDRAYVNIAVCHCFMSGCSVSDSESPIYIGASGEVSSSLFDFFDLVLLGHLHSPQKAGENGFYSGSPVKYSFSDENRGKGVNIFDINGGKIDRRFLSCEPINDMKTICGEFDALLEQARKQPSEDYIHIHLTDKRPIFMPMQRLREFYPNILEMSSELFPAPDNVDAAPTRRNFASPKELFKEFCSQICGIEADDEELKIFEEIAEEAEQ